MLFEKAARAKLRFDTPKGSLVVEDLFDVPLSGRAGSVNLDDMIKPLYQELKSGNEISFVTKKTEVSTTTQLKFDIIKHVIDTRLAEDEASANAVANKTKKQYLLSILAAKEGEALANKTPEEIKEMIEAL
jgi:hypothetical protein